MRPPASFHKTPRGASDMETTLLYALLVVSSGVVGFVGCDVFRRFRFRRRARAMAVRAPRATVKVRCSPRGRPDGPCTLMHTHVMLGLPDGHFASCYDHDGDREYPDAETAATVGRLIWQAQTYLLTHETTQKECA